MKTAQVPTVGSDHERPAFIPHGDSHMFGILTTPAAPSRRIGVLFANGAGVVPCCGRNQFWAKLARELGASGFHVLRFDYPGAGDSPGVMRSPDFDNPLSGEVAAAYEWLAEQDVDGCVVIGKCFGGRNAAYAIPRLHDLRGLAMLSTPVTQEMKADNRLRNTSLSELLLRVMKPENLRRYVGAKRRKYARAATRRLGATFRAAPRKLAIPHTETLTNPAMTFFERLDPVLAASTPVLVLHGTDDAYFTDVRIDSREGHLAKLIRRYGDGHLQVHFIEGRVHGFGRVAVQEQIRGMLRSWVEDTVAAHGSVA